MNNSSEKQLYETSPPDSQLKHGEEPLSPRITNDNLSKETFRSTDDDVESNATHEGREAVTRVAAVNQVLSDYGARTWFGGKITMQPLKVVLLVLLFLQGYASGLDGLLSGQWQTYASNFFGQSAQSGSINTVKGIIAAAVLVPYARLSDRIGRVEAWLLATVMFTIGRVVTAAAPGFGGLFAGSIIWEFGYAGFRMLAMALTTDLSGLRDRTFFLNIYLMPIIINLWISGDIAQEIMDRGKTYWRWGYGMFAIIVPVVTIVFALPYFYAQGIAKRRKILPSFKFRKHSQSWKGAIWDLIVDLDLVGVIMFAASLVLVLLPLTIAGGAGTKWKRGYIIAMICVGGAILPFFLIWELKYSKAPFIPKKRLQNTFYFALAMEFCWRLALSVEMTYLRFVLLVGFGESPKSTQRLAQLYDFMQACTSIVIGVILHFWPHPKVFVVAGSFIGLLGMGLMYKYRVAYDGISGFIGADVLIGLGGGMMRYPRWTLVHAGIPRDQSAVATGFLLTLYQVGAAVGACVATAVWTQKLAPRLIERLGPKLGMQVYKKPLDFIKKYPLHSKERDLILDAYSYIQRMLIIVSIAFAALVVLLTLGLHPYTVDERQSLTDEEREEVNRKQKESRFKTLKWIVGY